MADTIAKTQAPSPTQEESLRLRLSTGLQNVPAERAPAPPPAPAPAPPVAAVPVAPVPAPLPPTQPMVANAQPEQPREVLGARTPPITWLFVSATLLAGTGWIIERRKRRLLETEKDSVLWADVQPPPGPSSMDTHQALDDILPDSPNADEKARAIYVTAIGETTSRREATLIDIHQLEGKINRRRQRGDFVDALLLLQQHLVDFRYTSPWAFLELRELYKQLGRQKEWDIARTAFRQRFGQNAPAWDAPSNAEISLLEDPQLAAGLARDWPYRESRMFVLKWVLGDPQLRTKCVGPPLLPLGFYRDLLFLDTLLDEVITAKQDRVNTDLAGLEVSE